MASSDVTVVLAHGAWPGSSLVAKQDRMIREETQRFMAGPMNAQLRSHPVDHSPIVSAPDAVMDIIREAIAAVG
ncbi:MAG TPA: hypothetical protein VMU22_07840 [Rhizomicrobium sp.]|nr:hypothetical protein [Rhizomicrobium sp.]